MWLAVFDFQTPRQAFLIFLGPNGPFELVTSRFPPKMGNSSTPTLMGRKHINIRVNAFEEQEHFVWQRHALIEYGVTR